MRPPRPYFHFFLIMFLTLAFANNPAEAASTFTIQGRITKPDGSVLETANVLFKTRILSPDNNACILYEESQTKDLTGSSGTFTLTLNDGTGTRTDGLAYAFEKSFSNQRAFSVPSAQCGSGSGTVTYTPAADDERIIVVYFREAGASTWEQIPAMTLSHSSYAVEANESLKVEGFGSSNLCRVVDGAGHPAAATAFTIAQFAELLNVASGNYAKTASNGATNIPTVAGNPSSGLTAGQIWYDSSAGQMKYYDGAVKTFGTGGGGSGSVTSVTAGTGLNVGAGPGGSISSTGTLNVNVGTGASQIVQLDSSAKLPALDGSALTALNAANISAGTLAVARGGTGATSMTANALVMSNGTGSAYTPLVCSTGESVTFTSAGAAVCANGSAGNGLVNGGNSFAAAATLGTNDAQALKFETNNTTRMTIHADGSVGIGTASASSKLHVEDSVAAGDVEARVRNSSDTGKAKFTLYNDASHWLGFELFGSNHGNVAMRDSANLTTYKDMYFTTSSGVQNGGNGKISFLTGGWDSSTQTRVTIGADGKVGIGTGTPSSLLTLNGNDATVEIKGTGSPGISLGTSSNSARSFAFVNDGNHAYFKNQTDGAGNFVFRSSTNTDVASFSYGAAANSFILDSSGKIGIGTSSPGEKLAVGYGVNNDIGVGTATNNKLFVGAFNDSGVIALNRRVTDGVFANTSRTEARIALVGDNNDSQIVFSTTDTNNTMASERMRINKNGYVGIGVTNPTYRLQIASDSSQYPVALRIEESTHAVSRRAALTFGNWEFGQDPDGNGVKSFYLFDLAAMQNRWTIRTDGNMGVGTINPNYKLEVNGTIAPTGDGATDLGASGHRFRDIYASNAIVNTSDIRAKKEVRDSDLGLDFINDLRPVSYHWKNGDDKLHYGVIAQETEGALRKAKEASGQPHEVDNVIVSHDAKTDAYGVRYTELISPMIKAIQELYVDLFGVKSEVATLKAKNTALEARVLEGEKENALLKARLDQIETRLNSK